MSTKKALTVPNIADEVHRRLESMFGPLLREISRRKMTNVWFTGSTVWTALYGMPVPEDADLDIFVVRDAIDNCPAPPGEIFSRISDGRAKNHRILMELFQRASVPPPLDRMKKRTSLGGDRFYTERMSVDIWTCAWSDPRQQLMNYPAESHGQARTAYNPTTGELIVLRNPMASAAARPAPAPWEVTAACSKWSLLDKLMDAPKAAPADSLGEFLKKLRVPDEYLLPKRQPEQLIVDEVVGQKADGARWNSTCPRCGRGVYVGLFAEEHEGGSCLSQ